MTEKLNGKSILLDTTVLLKQLNGEIDIAEQLWSAKELFISSLSEAEILAGVEKKDIKATRKYLDIFISIPVNGQIAELAGIYMATLGERRGLKGYIVAATAEVYKLTLVTTIKKSFQGLLSTSPVLVDSLT